MNGRRQGRSLSLLLGCLLFVVALRCEAQNLVFNHSFELYDTCEVFNGVYYPENGPVGWFSAAGSPDHMISCLPYGSFNSAPLNSVAFQYPQDGDSYSHVITYRGVPANIREYFMVHLTEPLVVGQQYYASFYASVAWDGYPINPPMWIYTSGFGMTFTIHPRQWELDDPYPIPWNFAHVYSPELITDTIGWTLVSGSFVADSAYQYVILGNSFDNANTDTVHIAGPINNSQMGGVLVDNVCVSPNPKGCVLSVDMETVRNGGWSIHPNPAQDRIMISGLVQGTPIDMYDLQGRMVWNGVVASDRMQLEVAALPRGSYILRWMDRGKQGCFKLMLTE